MRKKTTDTATLEPGLSYEAALGELEAWVQKMESGTLPLDDLLSAYQRSSALLAFCRSRLEAVEEQVKVLEAGKLRSLGEREDSGRETA